MRGRLHVRGRRPDTLTATPPPAKETREDFLLRRHVFDDTSSSCSLLSSFSLLSSLVSSCVARGLALPFVFARVVFFAFFRCCFFSFFFFWVFFAAFFSRHGGLDPASRARFLAMLRYFCGMERDGAVIRGGGSVWVGVVR